MDVKIFRINYKSDFILTLNSDAGWMTPFCIKFWTGAPSQAYFAGYDGETYTHCAPVDGEPTKLRVQFDDHRLPIGDLKFQISYHFTVADFPDDTEDEVINPASIIVEINGEQYQVMLDFTGETAPEIAFSLPAYANEAQRIANEQQRIAAEEQRIANEQTRIAAETTRQQNEEQRIQQESMRVRVFAQLKQESETATADANAASTLANEKAQLAADKAELADDAATLANAKAQLAADKAALADDAATLANDKAALAQQKADYAQTQGDYAKAQGDYAKQQGEIAEEDHERAEADHTRAESDHAAVELYVDSLGAFDISAYHATGGVLAKYADLTAALGTNGANIPEAIRKGGMSVKFVLSSDNKYVQARCMAQNFTDDVTQWQGVDDEPTAGSSNLVESGGVCKFSIDSILNNTFIKESVGENTVYKYPFFDGASTFVFENIGLNRIKLYLRTDNSTTGQYLIDIQPGKSVKYIPSSSFNTIFFYYGGYNLAGSFRVYPVSKETLDTKDAISNLDTKIGTETTFSTGEKVKTVGIDTEPIPNSSKLPNSDGTFLFVNKQTKDYITIEELVATSTLTNKLIDGDGNLSSNSFYSVKLFNIEGLSTLKIQGQSVGLSASYIAFAYYSSSENISSATLKKKSTYYISDSFIVNEYIPQGAVILALVQEYSSASVNFVCRGYSTLEKSKFETISEAMGDISDLVTEDKTSVVNAVNEVYDRTEIKNTKLIELEGTQYSGYINSYHNISTTGPFKYNLFTVAGKQKVKITNHRTGNQTGGLAIWYGFYTSAETINSSTFIPVGSDIQLQNASNGQTVDLIVPNNARVLITSGMLNTATGSVYSTVAEYVDVKTSVKEGIVLIEDGLIEVKKDNNSLVIGQLFKDKKIGITIGQGGANNLIDFRNIFTYDLESHIYNPTNISYVISSVGDMHAPFKFRTDNLTSDTAFTGGNHAYESNSVKTAVLDYVKFYADGKLIEETEYSGICRNIKIEWSNLVKPGNAYAASDDYALRETHTLVYNGIEFEEWVDLEPLVDIHMGLWYGLQLMPITGQTSIMFAGAANRLKYGVISDVNSGDKYCSRVIAESTNSKIIMMVDNSFDLGKRELSSASNRGAFFVASTKKSYFTIIRADDYSVNMQQGNIYCLHGFFQVMPK